MLSVNVLNSSFLCIVIGFDMAEKLRACKIFVSTEVELIRNNNYIKRLRVLSARSLE